MTTPKKPAPKKPAPKKPTQRKTVALEVRIGVEAFEALTEHAGRAGVDVEEHIRSVLLDAAEADVCPTCGARGAFT